MSTAPSSKTQKSRKVRTCAASGAPIAKGDTYVRYTVFAEGHDPFHYDFHPNIWTVYHARNAVWVGLPGNSSHLAPDALSSHLVQELEADNGDSPYENGIHADIYLMFGAHDTPAVLRAYNAWKVRLEQRQRNAGHVPTPIPS